MMQNAEKAGFFARHAFFRDMSPEVLARLTAHARSVTYASGTKIFAKGDPSYSAMAVVSGIIRISVASEGATELTLNLIGPDGIFGEIALIDGQPRTADATAMTPCSLLVLERRDFLDTIAREPAAALTLLKVVTGRLRRTSQQLEQASFRPMSKRLAEALMTLAGPDDAAATRIRMPQRQIGNMIGLSRESTNRHLREWQRAGMIELRSGSITICNRKALAKLAEDQPAG